MEEGSSWHQCVLAAHRALVWMKLTLSFFFAVLHYATRFVERYNCLVEYREHNRDAREVQLAQSDEGLNENQEQLDGRHGDLSGQAVHWTTTNDNLERTLTNVEHGLHHQLRISPTDDQHNGAQP